jgi:hypothetical protein
MAEGLDETLVGVAREVTIQRRGTQNGTRRLAASEELARRLDVTGQRAMFSGLPDIDSWIERLVFEKQQTEGLSRNDALRAVSQGTPELFLTRARMELGQINRNQSIYFDLQNGQLVNPAVMEDGVLKPLNAPALNTTELTPPEGATANQILAVRVAEKMQQLAASGATTTYGDALRLVAAENPGLVRHSHCDARGRFI